MVNNLRVHKGEIYYINNSPYYVPSGTEIAKDRPGVVVSSNEIDDNCEEYGCVIVPLTSKPKYFSDFHCTIHSSGRPSTVLAEQVKYIDKSRLGDYIGTVSDEEMADIERCIERVFGIFKEKSDAEEEVSRLKKALADKDSEMEFMKDECDKKLREKEVELRVYKEVYEKMTDLATKK